jgi:hypothetical protein
MGIYGCDGFKAVEADSPHGAAVAFANRKARREFGKRGYCRTARLDNWTENGHVFTFEAFIGYDVERGTCSGHNIWLYVRPRPDAETGVTLIPEIAFWPD